MKAQSIIACQIIKAQELFALLSYLRPHHFQNGLAQILPMHLTPDRHCVHISSLAIVLPVWIRPGQTKDPHTLLACTHRIYFTSLNRSCHSFLLPLIRRQRSLCNPFFLQPGRDLSQDFHDFRQLSPLGDSVVNQCRSARRSVICKAI